MNALKFLLHIRLWVFIWILFVVIRYNFVFGNEEEKIPALDWQEVEQSYQENGMSYAISLYQKQDGSKEDDLRAKKSDLLNYKIRQKTIQQSLLNLERTKSKELKRELMRRLGSLHDEQAENISRQGGKDIEVRMKDHLEQAISWYGKTLKSYPGWNADFLLFAMAEDYAKLKNYPAAEIRYRELIQKQKNSPLLSDALLALGNLFFEKQGYGVARSFFKQILQTKEEKLYAYAHYKMAWCYFNESANTEAMTALEQAIKESRRLQLANNNKKLGVEEEALSDLVLFYSEYANPHDAKIYFEKIASSVEKSRDLRFLLVKRYYEHGQHANAKTVASSLLTDDTSNEQKNKLYLILISVAEKLKDRNLSLEIAQKYSCWLKVQQLSKQEEKVESEEYLRLYAQRLHYEAETLKKQEIWLQAKKSYEIYLDTYGTETDSAEARFRYSILLMNQKDFLKANDQIKLLLTQIQPQHTRHKESYKLLIQSMEFATSKQNKTLNAVEQLSAYDNFLQFYPEDPLSMEASYKAAQVAKKIESPTQVAQRLRAIAIKYPDQKLAKSALAESLSVLVEAGNWAELKSASMDAANISLTEDADKNNLMNKILESKELAMLKIAETLEKEEKIAEAIQQYESFLEEKTSDHFQRFSIAKLASLAEKKLSSDNDAIKYWNIMIDRFAETKEGKQAHLELARLHEKNRQPEDAIKNYLLFSSKTGGHLASMTNAAILLENTGERDKAGKLFFTVAEKYGLEKKDGKLALESACNNFLLNLHEVKNEAAYRQLANCAQKIGSLHTRTLLWQAREAWALTNAGETESAQKIWSKIAKLKVKNLESDLDKNLYAVAKVKELAQDFENFQQLKFSKTNEKPEANIVKKSKLMESLEAKASQILKFSTAKQATLIQKILVSAYLDFADTMETAAFPSKLKEEEKKLLQESFNSFAQEMKKKATSLEEKQYTQERSIASVHTKSANEDPAISDLL